MSHIEFDQIAPEDIVPIKRKLGFASTAFGSQLVHGIFMISTLFYYREIMLLQEIYIIIAFGLYAIWNAVNDPLFGWLSDRTSTRWGRRIPYYWIFTPMMTISFILLWVSPTVEVIGQIGVFFWLLLFLCLYDTAFTATLLVWSALGQELSMDHRERASIQVYSLMFAVPGTLAALLLPMLFLAGAGREGFIFISIILGILQFIFMMITAITVKEKLEFSQVDKPLGLKDSLKHTFKSKSFIITVAMNFWLIFTQAVLFANLYFYTSYVFPGSDPFMILIVTVSLILIGLAVGTFYTVKVNEKKGVKTAMIRSIFWQAVGFLLIGILPGFLALLGFFFVGMGLYGAMSLFNAAFGEVCDEDEVKTGTRREAAIFGTNALITKPAESFAGMFIAFMLLVFLYQQPIGGVQQVQSDFTILGIKTAMGIVPAVVLFLSLLIYKFSPLHGQYLKEIKTKISHMHEEKREKLKQITSKQIKN